MKLNSLSVKLLLAQLAGMVLSITLLLAAAVAVLQGSMLARLDLADAADEMASRVLFDGGDRPVMLMEDEHSDINNLAWVFDSLRRETAYRVLDSAGNVALLSPAGAQFWPKGGDVDRLVPGIFDFEREGVVMYGMTKRLERGGMTWYFQMAVSDRFMTLLHRVALPLVAAGVMAFSVVLLAVFGLGAFITVRYTLKPLRMVSESAAAISPRTLHARLKTEAVPAEIGPLVESFNRVLERVEHGYRVQQEFLANAAHELKTPLALIRAQIELEPGQDGSRDSLLGDVKYMSRQVQQLLLLAEASEVYNYQFKILRIGETALEAVAYLQRMAEAAQVQLTVSAPASDVKWTADRGALFTLIKNLLENAIQHAPVGTVVDVEIRHNTLAVRDFGPGVDAAQLPLLFVRFWRGAHRRDHGAGLGLAICQEIAQAHGWTLTAESAEPGLRFRVVASNESGN